MAARGGRTRILRGFARVADRVFVLSWGPSLSIGGRAAVRRRRRRGSSVAGLAVRGRGGQWLCAAGRAGVVMVTNGRCNRLAIDCNRPTDHEPGRPGYDIPAPHASPTIFLAPFRIFRMVVSFTGSTEWEPQRSKPAVWRVAVDRDRSRSPARPPVARAESRGRVSGLFSGLAGRGPLQPRPRPRPSPP